MTNVREFHYKELDEEGEITLDVLSSAGHLNRWMFETIRPYVSEGDLLEIGSGTGNISSIFLQNGYPISLSDIRPRYVKALQKKFSQEALLKSVYEIDLVDRDFDSIHKPLFNSFDTVFALNVIEHIQDHQQALENINKLLRAKGRFIMLVPAYESIYNRFDKELYHFRRYNRKSASRLFTDSGFNVLNSFYFNAAGIAGWVFFGGILKQRTINKDEVSVYNSLVPIFKIVDKMLLKRIGLSVVVVGEKKA